MLHRDRAFKFESLKSIILYRFVHPLVVPNN